MHLTPILPISQHAIEKKTSLVTITLTVEVYKGNSLEGSIVCAAYRAKDLSQIGDFLSKNFD